ncbi:MAG: hypothetical protein D6689_18430 [Deltaproteobacteria bacterium]|nr:MAG: hypothetical protein D6689_18430 [Deltaproteobacteria bacterium]
MRTQLPVGARVCDCRREGDGIRFIAVTGGPGAGKTAVLELALRALCHHVAIVPEAASIVFGGGFPRRNTDAGGRAAQRAIFHVQRELEALAAAEPALAVALCDRGTVDGVAYWPGPPDTFWPEVGTTREAELARYAAVVHLRTPGADEGYNHRNALRTESAEQARAIDERILAAWEGHPNRIVIPSSRDFFAKATRAIDALRAQLPAGCRDAVARLTAAPAQSSAD